MIEAKQLIDINNHKRTELTVENEKYYSDFLLYIRLQFFLSEQQSEEILMEILDHLIEGQKDGKTARDILGDDPKAFADELIQQLPNESKKFAVKFISGIALSLISYFLMIRGLVLFIGSFFKSVDTAVYPLKSVLIFLMLGIFTLSGIWVIFKLIRESLFNENKSHLKDSIKIGSFWVVGMGAIVAIAYFLPDFGPSFHFNWISSILSGIVIWGISKFIKEDKSL